MPTCAIFSGSPSLPFTHRWSNYVAHYLCYTDWVLGVLIIVMPVRVAPHLDWLGVLWLAVEGALCVASIACELKLRRRPDSRLALVREALSAVWLALACGGGRVGQLLKAVVDDWDAPPHNIPVAAVVVLFASHAAVELLIWAKLVRLSLALPLHLSFLKHLLNSNTSVCQGAALQTPAACWLISGAFTVFDLPRRAVAPPSWVIVDVLPQLECATVLSFFQLCIGFCLPLVIQAVWESKMFRQHQAQRRAEGLPPEHGWQAAVYEGIAAFWEPFDHDVPLLLGLAAGLPCLLWQVALMLTGAESMDMN